MSLDAHIFSTELLAKLVMPLGKIDNPNLLEGSLAIFCLDRK